MNSLISSQSISHRKAQLYSQISNAIEENNEKLLFLLEGLLVHRYGLESLEEYKTRVHEIFNQTSFEQKTFNEGPENRDKNTYDSSFEEQSNKKEPNISFEKLEDSQVLFNEKKDPQSTDTTKINEIAEKINHHRDIDSEPSLITPPPSPSISHLRRWLAPLEEDLPKAS